MLFRSGLNKYDVQTPLSGEMTANLVRLPLSMHIGAPSVACVSAGDKVVKGQMIASANNGLSVALHASVSGTVKFVGNEIIIEADR